MISLLIPGIKDSPMNIPATIKPITGPRIGCFDNQRFSPPLQDTICPSSRGSMPCQATIQPSLSGYWSLQCAKVGYGWVYVLYWGVDFKTLGKCCQWARSKINVSQAKVLANSVTRLDCDCGKAGKGSGFFLFVHIWLFKIILGNNDGLWHFTPFERSWVPSLM